MQLIRKSLKKSFIMKEKRLSLQLSTGEIDPTSDEFSQMRPINQGVLYPKLPEENEKMNDNDNLQKVDVEFMTKALQEAKVAFDEGEIPIGAVITCKGRIISRAHNLTETLCDVTAHAEMQAITAAANNLGGKYLTDCTLYVTVEPCTMCAGAIGWAQISRLVYGAEDEKKGYHKFAPYALHPKTTVTKGVMEEECRNMIQEFFRKKR
jgi:tRNA(adenine34) deaminase